MKQFLFTLSASILGALVAFADITVGIPVQLLESEHDLLPDKTIESTYKPLKYKKGADAKIIEAVDKSVGIVCDNAYDCRTFLLILSCDDTQIHKITITDIDPTTVDKNECQVLGAIINKGRHFLIKYDKENEKFIKSIFETDKGKIKYEREFEFVEEKTEQHPTLVEGTIKSVDIEYTQAIVEGNNLNNKKQ